MTIFEGYKIGEGEFPNKDTGEVVHWKNYTLYFKTDEDPDVIGFKTADQKARFDHLIFTGFHELKEIIGKEVYMMVDLTARKDEDGKVRQFVNHIVLPRK